MSREESARQRQQAAAIGTASQGFSDLISVFAPDTIDPHTGVPNQPSFLVETSKGAVAGATTGAALGSVIPGVGTAIGAGIGAMLGWGIGAFSAFGKKDEREEAIKEHRKRVDKAWRRAVKAHQAKLRSFGSSVSQQERAISTAKVRKLAAAAGAGEAAADQMLLAATSGTGSVNTALLRQAASAKASLEQRLVGQEYVLERKLTKLGRIQDLIDKEIGAERSQGRIDEEGKAHGEWEVDTEVFEELTAEVESYQQGEY